jgi:polygalacturonase
LIGCLLLVGLGNGRAQNEAGYTAPAIAPPQIPDKKFSVTDFGAVGDGKTLNTAALQKALDAVEKAGGGTLTVPAGKFLTGPLRLVSNLNLQLQKDAVLLLSDDMAAYPMRPGKDSPAHGFSVENAHDIEIGGEGTIDGQGAAWWAAFEGNPAQKRPFLVDFDQCARVDIEGITLTNSPMFHLALWACTDVTIKNITIRAPAKAHNTDGIDPSGTNYLITGCTIDTGDDNIAIKPLKSMKCDNFTISHCTFLRGHGMSIGSGSIGGIDHVTVSDCTFNQTNAGIRIKTARGRGGLVQHISYDHLTMTKVNRPIEIVDYYPKTPKSPNEDPPQPVTDTTPTFAHIAISNVTATDCPAAGFIWGLPEMPISGITFTNVNLQAEKGLLIYHAQNIKFVGSKITVPKGDKVTVFDATVDGISDL